MRDVHDWMDLLQMISPSVNSQTQQLGTVFASEFPIQTNTHFIICRMSLAVPMIQCSGVVSIL